MVVVTIPVVLLVGAGWVNLWRMGSMVVLGRGGPGMAAGLLFTLAPVIYMIGVPLHHKYFVHYDFPSLLRTLEHQRRAGETVIVSVDAVPCVRYYAPEADASFLLPPMSSGTGLAPGYDFYAAVRRVLHNSGDRCWLISTSSFTNTSHRKLIRIFTQAGYDVRVVAEAGTDGHYGLSQLLLATRKKAPPRM